MGALTSIHNWSGREVGGVILGNPVTLDDGTFLWDGNVPDGVVDDVGNVVTATVGQLVAVELAPSSPPVTAAEKGAGVASLAVVEDKIVARDGRDKVVDMDKLEIAYNEPTPVFAEMEVRDAKPV